MWWNWKLVFLILGTTTITYFCGLGIKKTEKKSLRTLLLVSALVITLGALFFFKYAEMLVNTALSIGSLFSGTANDYVYLNIILPVGISFYTFQTLSYVIDVYQNKIEPEKNFLWYALYVSFFPQLVAGPIERPENLIPQLKNEEGINIDNLASGFKLMLVGFVKKIAIADMIGVYVNKVYSDINNANGLLVLVATLLFSVQILCDFSGYSDIAKGTAKLFNIDLMVNFDHPYQATSVKDFWRRWHISLSSWLKDYIYYPLGGSRVPTWRWMLNTIIVFTISGLWHGASWTYVIWGLAHGLLLVIEKYYLILREKVLTKMGKNPKGSFLTGVRVVITFVVISLTWVMFRANSIQDMGTAFRLLFTSWNFSPEYFANFVSCIPFTVKDVSIILLGVIIFIFADKFNFPKSATKGQTVWHTAVYVGLVWVVMFAFIYLNSMNIESSFIYFQF